MAILTPHWEALTSETRQAFQIAASLSFIKRYYLAGGTGLALHLGHLKASERENAWIALTTATATAAGGGRRWC